MSPKLLTFQQVLPKCEEGDREAWQVFLGSHTPIALKLLGFYSNEPRSDRQKQIWMGALGALAAEGYKRLRSFNHHAEREFLIDLRAFLFEFVASRLDASDRVSSVSCPTSDLLVALLKGLPLAHQEMVFLKLAGHSDAVIEKILRFPPSVAQKTLESLGVLFPAILRLDRDACPWPAAWLEVLQHARTSGMPECPPLHVFVRILDGQTTWYEKGPAEGHLARCLHCLESWIALREVNYLRNEVKPLPSAEVKDLLSCLTFAASPRERKPFLGRLFGS